MARSLLVLLFLFAACDDIDLPIHLTPERAELGVACTSNGPTCPACLSGPEFYAGYCSKECQVDADCPPQYGCTPAEQYCVRQCRIASDCGRIGYGCGANGFCTSTP